jgi:hypothetical protein
VRLARLGRVGLGDARELARHISGGAGQLAPRVVERMDEGARRSSRAGAGLVDLGAYALARHVGDALGRLEEQPEALFQLLGRISIVVLRRSLVLVGAAGHGAMMPRRAAFRQRRAWQRKGSA